MKRIPGSFPIRALAHPSKDDEALMTFLKDKNIKNFKTTEAKALDEWLEVIENSTLGVWGRFHHSIAAFCFGTPFITLNSNTPKIDGFLTELGKESAIQYTDHDLFNKLINQTEVKLEES